MQHTARHPRHDDPPQPQSPGRIQMSRGISIEDHIGELAIEVGSGGSKFDAAPHEEAPATVTSSSSTSTSSPGAAGAAATTTTTMTPVGASHHSEDRHVGIIASGLAWVDRQRERRRRQYLQNQAEKQLQKIAEAELARKAGDAHHHHDHPRSDQQKHHQHNHHHHQQQHHPHDRNSHDRRQYQLPNGNTSTDGEGREPWHRRDFEDPSEQHGQSSSNDEVRIGKTDISKSGEGATAQLDLLDVLGGRDNVDNDDDDEVGDQEEEEDDFDDDRYVIPEVRVDLVAGDSTNPFILSPDQMHEIACRVLPKTIAFCRWRRLYGLNRDGDSFDGCIRIVGDAPRTLLVIRTTRGAIFGGYTDTPWMSHDHNNARFYGSAAACLFSFSNPNGEMTGGDTTGGGYLPTPSPSSSRSTSPAQSSRLNVYRWTGKNRYIQLCDTSHKMLAFGGGGADGAFGLCVQDDFTRGSTGPCDTFGNAPLCEPGNFDIVDVEFWEFLTGVF